MDLPFTGEHQLGVRWAAPSKASPLDARERLLLAVRKLDLGAARNDPLRLRAEKPERSSENARSRNGNGSDVRPQRPPFLLWAGPEAEVAKGWGGVARGVSGYLPALVPVPAAAARAGKAGLGERERPEGRGPQSRGPGRVFPASLCLRRPPPWATRAASAPHWSGRPATRRRGGTARGAPRMGTGPRS